MIIYFFPAKNALSAEVSALQIFSIAFYGHSKRFREFTE